MRLSSRLLTLIVVLSLGVTAAMGQPSASDVSFTAVQQSPTPSSSEAAQSSLVLRNQSDPGGEAVGVRAERLGQYASANPLGTDDAVLQTVSFDVSETPSAPVPQSNNGTRTALYIIGGVLVAGGAVAGILALSSGPEPIPAPPGRP